MIIAKVAYFINDIPSPLRTVRVSYVILSNKNSRKNKGTWIVKIKKEDIKYTEYIIKELQLQNKKYIVKTYE